MHSYIFIFILIAVIFFCFSILLFKFLRKAKLPEIDFSVLAKDRVILPDGDKTNGLGTIFAKLFVQTLESSGKIQILSKMNLSIGIQDADIAETAISIICKDTKIVVQNGIINKPNIYISGDLYTLVSLTSLSKGISALFSRDGIELVKKILKGALKVKGIFLHLSNFRKFRILIS